MDSPVTFKIIPGADTVVVLKRELVEFAVHTKPKKPTVDQNTVSETSITDSPEASATVPNDSAPSIPQSTPPVLDAIPETSKIPQGIAYYHVYSGALMEASPVFRRMLTGEKWTEGRRKDDGKFYITAEDAKIHDLVILFNIMHLNDHRVPEDIGVEQLARLAVMVDYYECLELVQAWVSRWLTAMSPSARVPSSESPRNTTLWICISLVFRLEQEFKQSTEVAVVHKKGLGLLPTYGLPIVKVICKLQYNHRIIVLTLDSGYCLQAKTSSSPGAWGN